MSTLDDANNVLDELQAFLSQYSVDDSQLSDSNEFSSGAFVSPSPLGLTPRLGMSARNSPHLIKQSLSTSDKSLGDPASPNNKWSPDDSVPNTPRFSFWSSKQNADNMTSGSVTPLRGSSAKNTPRLIRQSSSTSTSRSKPSKALDTPRKVSPSLPNGETKSSPRLIRQSAVHSSSSYLKKDQVGVDDPQKCRDDHAPYISSPSSRHISNDVNGSEKAGQVDTKRNVLSEDSKINFPAERDVGTRMVRNNSHQTVATGTSKDNSNKESFSANSENTSTGTRVPSLNPSMRGDDGRFGDSMLHLGGGSSDVNTGNGNKVGGVENANILNGVREGKQVNITQRGPEEAAGGIIGKGGGEGEGDENVNKGKADGNGYSNLGPDRSQRNAGEPDSKLLKAQTGPSLGAGNSGKSMGNKPGSQAGSHISDPTPRENENFSFGTTSSHLYTPASTDTDTAKNKRKNKKAKSKHKEENDAVSGNSYSPEERVDMYEIVPDDEEDVLGSPSPGVPELIVDVLKADVNSEKADEYSVPSLDLEARDLAPIFNRAETSQDDVQTSKEIGESLKNKEGDNKNTNDAETKWRSPDSGLHYPIIYRRSKKDPGSKQYNELVKELSVVLEKRAERTQSMREEKSGVALNVDTTDHGRRVSKSTESLNIFANKSLLNKLENHLLSKSKTDKLISDERGTAATPAGRSYSVDSADVDLVHVLRKHENKNNNATESPVDRPAVANSGNNPQIMHSKPIDGESVYAVPNKKVINSQAEPVYAIPNKGPVDTYGKRVSAKLIYDHSSSFSNENESPAHDLSFLPDDLTSHKRDFATKSNTLVQHVNAHHNVESETLDNRRAETHESSAYHEKQNQKIHVADDNVTTHRHYEKHHQRQHHHHHYQDQHHLHQFNGHSLSWAHQNEDGRKYTTGVGTILAYTPPLNHHVNDDDKNNNETVLRQKQSRPLSSSVIMPSSHCSSNMTRHSLDSSDSSSQGHSTTIKISGSGLRRSSKIMYSEPDLTRGSLGSDLSSTENDAHYVVTKTDHRIIPAPHLTTSSLARTSHYHKHRQLDYHYSKAHQSLDNLRMSNSFDKNPDSRVNISFDHVQTYDMSFGSETFDEEDFRGSTIEQGSFPVHHPYMVRVNVVDRNGTNRPEKEDGSVDTYFITTTGQPTISTMTRSSSNVTSPRSRSVSMTTVVEHSKNKGHGEDHPAWSSIISQQGQNQERKVTVLRAVSLKSNSSTATSSSRAKIARAHTLDNNTHHDHHHHHHSSHPRLYRIVSPKRDHSFTSDRSAGSWASQRSFASGSTLVVGSDELSASNMYVVVPPQPPQPRVPDLIVDHKDATPVRHTGSPFHQDISEGTLPTAHGEGLYKGEEDKPATFMIDARNMRGDPAVQVDGPNAIAKCSIDPLPDGQYKVTYIPVEVGLFDVSVKWNGKEIPGSPFHPKVVDSRKVKVVGGWQHYMDGQERVHLVVGEEKKIPFDTSEAGPGQLRAEVKSPSAFIPVEVDDSHKGRSVVKFVPKEEGNHYIHLYWSDIPLVNSPYLGYATSGMADPSKVWLTGRGLKEAVVREEAEFIIDGSQAGPGEPDVELTGVRAEIQVFTTPLGGGKYRCTYIPVIPGAYLLNISWNGRQLRGAPYKVNVIGASYPNRVVVNGEGLRGGLLGQNLDFRIDTRKAGPGELTAYCMGPTKVAYCELSDHHDGTYRLVVRPQEVGRHVLQIKYGGEHVQGSPFPFKVSAQPDASKVRVSGPGVEHGILANFQSQFIVETKGAGAGQLTVRIRGPKGAFQVEMYRESQKDRTILCRYYPSMTGLYIINVRWSGVDVPGSPFHVNILDTQQELEQVLHEQSFSGSGHHHFASHPGNSFHNTSINSNHMRFSTGTGSHQNSQHHNMSRSSGYYQWREGM